MAKTLSFSKGLGSILFWSIISAAFIGPGTVTTAAKAGSTFGFGLLWAMGFSIFGTFILQEAAARVTLGSGKNLGEVLAIRYGEHPWIQWTLFLTILLGCMAYQAGNLLGASEGLLLLGVEDRRWPATGIVLVAFLILMSNRLQLIARLMGLVVALMGIAFIYLAIRTGGQVTGSGGSASEMNWLALGLIGTTLVPYNLFLASGISRGQELREMRFGLGGAILIGGLISVAIMIAATNLSGAFGFQALGDALGNAFGPAGTYLFAFGLFAAGFTSSVTAPLAAAITSSSLLGSDWEEGSWRFRGVWLAVLLIGLSFVWLDVKPIPAIIAAQGLNGMLLPFIGFFLLVAMNDKRILPVNFLNSRWQNSLLVMVLLVVLGLGVNQLIQAISRVVGG